MSPTGTGEAACGVPIGGNTQRTGRVRTLGIALPSASFAGVKTPRAIAMSQVALSRLGEPLDVTSSHEATWPVASTESRTTTRPSCRARNASAG
jgi:hypothetical protein